MKKQQHGVSAHTRNNGKTSVRAHIRNAININHPLHGIGQISKDDYDASNGFIKAYFPKAKKTLAISKKQTTIIN